MLFGLILSSISSVIGVIAGAVQGYFGGKVDLLFQRFLEIWTSVPQLFLLMIISSVLTPSFFVLLGILLLFSWVSLVGLVRAEFLRGRNFEYVHGGAGARRLQHQHHVPAPVAERDGGDADLAALHPLRIGDDADRARLPGPRPAARLALARRVAVAGQGQHPGAVARHWPASSSIAIMLCAADLHRRSGARRLRLHERRSDEAREVDLHLEGARAMNKIVREHYPVEKLPEDLREGIEGRYVRVTLVPEEDTPARKPLTYAEIRACVKPRGTTAEEAVSRIRELRDEWDDK